MPGTKAASGSVNVDLRVLPEKRRALLASDRAPITPSSPLPLRHKSQLFENLCVTQLLTGFYYCSTFATLATAPYLPSQVLQECRFSMTCALKISVASDVCPR